MEKSVKTLSKLHPNDIHNELMRRQLPAFAREQIMKEAMALKKQRKAETLRKHKHRALWTRLLAPLKYEMNNAGVGLRLKSSITDPERYRAFDEYLIVMNKLFSGLEDLMLSENHKRTPVEIAKELGYPYAGVHWSDWISEKTKNRIRMLFDSIPYRAKAKRFEPFIRRMPPAMYKAEHSTLWLRTLNEYDLLLSNIEHEQDPDKRIALDKKQTRMLFALDKLAYSDKNPCLPFTWHGAYTQEEWQAIDDDPDADTLERLYQQYHDEFADLLAQAREDADK